MKASSESGECATVIVWVSVNVDIGNFNNYKEVKSGGLDQANIARRITSLDGVVNSIAFDSFEAGVLD